ncbi:thioesterase-like superfamily-domain-containing protein [Amylostereum chailletii]|nr:thioesterase-like superfamily-domain-containing protein [Amylostereum chailletii]
MPPYQDATAVKDAGTQPNGDHIYSGNISGEWTVAKVSHGGYLTGIAMEACIQHQSSTSHRDPIHFTAYFMLAPTIGPCEVAVRTIRSGKTFTNLALDLKRNEDIIITAHAIFGVLDPAMAPPDPFQLTLSPPHPFARRTPFHAHPSTLKAHRYGPIATLREHVRLADDPTVHEGHESTLPNDTGGVQLGYWASLSHPFDMLTPASLLFFADPHPCLIPHLTKGSLPPTTHTTVVLSIEFKAPIPREAAKHTVGTFLNARFIQDPKGRHDLNVELWTAPSDIGDQESTVKDGWREEQKCLLIARHMTLIVPMETVGRKKKANKAEGKL